MKFNRIDMAENNNKAFDANNKFIGETKKIGGGIYELVKK